MCRGEIWGKGKGGRVCHPRRVMCIYMCVCMDLGPQPCFLGCFFAISLSKDQNFGDGDGGGIPRGKKVVDVHRTREARGKSVWVAFFVRDRDEGSDEKSNIKIHKQTKKFPLQKKAPSSQLVHTNHNFLGILLR